MSRMIRAFFFVAIALVAAVAMHVDRVPEPAGASFPGENGKLTAAVWNGNDYDIHTVDPSGGVPTPLIAGAGWQTEPAWSADGERIAFSTSFPGDGVFVASANGTQQRQVAQGASPAWSPDGTKLVFARKGEDLGLSVVDVDEQGNNGASAAPQAITHADDSQPDWSPDGTQIAFCRWEEVGDTIDSFLWIANADGSGAHRLNAAVESVSCSLTWSPDGAEIAIRARTGAVDGLYAIDASDGSARFLGNLNIPEATLCCPRNAWSPDGHRIAFIGPVAGGNFALKTLSSQGGDIQTVFEAGTIRDPAWQPLRSTVAVEFTQGIQDLQSPSALQSDISGDGQPPVPLVVGKEAAMRVYFGEVEDVQSFTVEVSGEVTATENLTIEPGCTAIDRRRNDAGCTSLDFFFTPPAGDWSVRLEVKDFADAVVLDEEFRLTSVETDGLKVAYIPICVRLTAGAQPACPSALIDTLAPDLMRKLFPAADTGISYDRLFAPALIYDEPLDTDAEQSALTVELRKRYDLMLAAGSDFDQLAGWLPPGGTPGTAGISDPVWGGSTGHVSWQQDTSANDLLDAQHTLSHEIAHNLGLRHTHLPDGCGARDANNDWPYTDSTIQEVGYDVFAREVMPDTQKDIMTYCTPPGSNIWISPHSYNKLLEGNFAPQGASLPASGPQQFLIISGTAQADGSAGMLDPAYVITSDVPADSPDPLGTHCLRLTGGTQLDYCFNLRFEDHRSQEPLDSEAFTLRVALPSGTTRVALAGGGNELAALEASPSAPTLDITEPQTGANWGGEQTITWSADDTDGGTITYTVLYSSDGGATWLPIEVDTTDPQFTFDTSALGGQEVLIRVLASDGLNTTVETTGPVTLGAPVLWGDNDCDGEISSRDNQALSRKILQQNALSQTPPCPALGDIVAVSGAGDKAWGDLDCDGEITSRDGQSLLRKVLQQNALSQTPPCPLLGDPVTTSAAAAAPARVRWWGTRP